MIRAAGILIVSKDGKALFLKRSKMGDMPGYWCIPGGKLEGDEEPIDAAIRETEEETGYKAKAADLIAWTRRCKDDVDFCTFILKGVDEFTPKLYDDEHVAYTWTPYESPPEPLHPGCKVALAKCGSDWNELKVAEAIRDGELVSPQFYENLALFDIRITGTGRAFRHEKKDDKGKVIQEEEITWRDPAIFANEEFVRRCNGLPVILEHPKTEMLDTDEYRERNVGSVFLPYLKPSPEPGEPLEVWGIAKIIDEPAARLMATEQLSTSPAVVWSDPSVNVEGTTNDGRKFLLEGKPSLLDHIAICWQGVWDKGGEPSGVVTIRGDSDMTAEEAARLAAEQEKKHKEVLTAIGGLSETVKGITARQDSIEETQKAIRQRFDDDDARRRDQARRECDSFKFSRRRKDEDDDSYAKRHDAEEGDLAEKLEAAGEKKEAARDKARGRRKDAEEDEKKVADSRRKDDDDDDDDAKRRRKDSKSSKDDDDDDDDAKRRRKDDDDDDDAKRRKDSKSSKDDDEDDDDARKDDDDDDDAKRRKDDDDDDDDDDDAKRRKDSKGRRDLETTGPGMNGKKDDDDDRTVRHGRRDSSVTSRLDALERENKRLREAQRSLTDEELNSFGKVQARADEIATCLGSRARGRMMGETLVSYRRHFMNEYKDLSPRWKGKDLTPIIANDALMTEVEDQIMTDALATAKSPASIKPGEMRMRTHRSDAGHIVNEWDGHPRAWMDEFAGVGKQAVKAFNTETRRNG